MKMGPLVWNILKDVYVSSQKAHLKTNGEEWLKLKQTKSYVGQKCGQANNQK